MITALGSIAAQQSKVAEKRYADTLLLLNYAPTHPNTTIRYTAISMILHIHINASFLSKPQARSCAGGNYFIGDMRPDMSKLPTTRLHLNGSIHSIFQIMSNVMGLAAEAEIGAAYINGQEAVPIRTLLLKLGNPQPATPFQFDNSTARRLHKRYHQTGKIESDWHALLLDTQLHKPTSVPHLLVAGHH